MHDVLGEVTFTHITVEEFNVDEELQNALRYDLAIVSSACDTCVTLLGAHVKDGGARRLLQQVIVVGYQIAFASLAEAEAAKLDLVVVDRLARVETFAEESPWLFSGMQVEVLDAIAVVEVSSAPSDSTVFGTSAIIGVVCGILGAAAALMVVAFAARWKIAREEVFDDASPADTVVKMEMI
jgi:hypothetical protein